MGGVSKTTRLQTDLPIECHEPWYDVRIQQVQKLRKHRDDKQPDSRQNEWWKSDDMLLFTKVASFFLWPSQISSRSLRQADNFSMLNLVDKWRWERQHGEPHQRWTWCWEFLWMLPIPWVHKYMYSIFGGLPKTVQNSLMPLFCS